MTIFEIQFIPMKYLIQALFSILFLSLTSCADTNAYKLSINVTDIPDQSKVYLRYIDGTNNPITIDSTTTLNGEAQLEGIQASPAMHYVFVENAPGNIPVIVTPGTIEIRAQKDSLQFAKLTGTDQNKWFSEFLKTSQGFSQRANGISEDLQNARANGKEAFINSLREEYTELQQEAAQYEIEFVTAHPSSLISVLLLERMFLSKSVDEATLKPLIEALTEDIKSSEAGVKLMTAWKANLVTAIGSQAQEFKGPNPEGREISLSEIKGKVTIIDFWAAWCKPCRAENPNVVSVYSEFHEKGLEIISISLDKNKEDWLAAIAADQMDWHHISTLQYFDDPIAKLYNINAIPATLILDENGTIVAKDLRGPALKAQISKMLP
ncbi:MAG: Thiol-disulfide oxidoreductase ResA [SAR116 cluster bacterium]|nr:MAG: Thiol-disulfide oxidoreductase ResA [SAR116 cluster bacterium]